MTRDPQADLVAPVEITWGAGEWCWVRLNTPEAQANRAALKRAGFRRAGDQWCGLKVDLPDGIAR